MNINDFNYDFPSELIALTPLKERSSSRLLVLENNPTNSINHLQFNNLVDLLTPNDLLVFNNSKVIPARLYAQKSTGGQVEILITQIFDQVRAQALIKANKPIKLNTTLCLAKNIVAKIIAKNADLFTLEFSGLKNIDAMLAEIGHIPLPPYIDRPDELIDRDRYQTVYAKHQGAIAAPTAGLHFDQTLLDALQQKGVQTAEVTLHVGIGTFQPVRVETIEAHKMHTEKLEVPLATVQKIQHTKAHQGRVIAVGTTTMRSLETAAISGTLMPVTGETSLFIYPGYKFQVVDALITNFHLPRSTLLMLVCAFAGQSSILHAYQQAIEHRYRFFSYGDAMFLTRKF